MDKEALKTLNRRLVSLRTDILREYPFFGRLLLRLPIGYSDCETAYTDMSTIVFDPKFAVRLSDDELTFVFLHELYHCILHHCTRGRGRNATLYNIACDIVVNSLILQMFENDIYRSYNMRGKPFTVDGAEVMHLTPGGEEGRNYTADEVYDMLLKDIQNQLDDLAGGGQGTGGGDPQGAPGIEQGTRGRKTIDVHDVWESIQDPSLDDAWDNDIRQAARACSGSGSGIPNNLERQLKELFFSPKVDWRLVLHDFIQCDRSDYSYLTPDKRYQGDVILPSFQENVYGSKVEKLWFVVDTSGSISDEALTEALYEIRMAIEQVGNLSGELSFFDSKVSEPLPFDDVKSLQNIKPVGGGGTSFQAIFTAMTRYYDDDELPTAVIILTDGYAPFPSEDRAKGVPVLWIMVSTEMEAPWGETIHIW